ncbi:crotonobetaine/carnitine-CoA ligase [Salinibacillus kushneri]|uniref:Crotonobetaine/carnitine-CoA ligase n=1 Tax=Salinibacillus kushneri TaxID=237682 RepID=A0A1H9Y5I0_9BACI|nr:acetyl-CoA carboxylase biotin carboxyl carrier protein subunit [Salinibacillus kushneri]SES63959.1 crotonobetaine/carnitine-CoA ligase [Salinibacillus kushneri]
MEVKSFEETLGTEEELVTKQLEKWADEIGEKTFIYYGEEDRPISYQRFNELANSVANNLLERGVQKGDRISVFLKNPFITTISMFAIWKAGAVYCPINFNYTGRLLSYQINDTEPDILITERQMVPLLNEIHSDIPTLSLILYDPKEGDHDYQSDCIHIEPHENFTTASFDEILRSNTSNPNIHLNYYDTANIIYTSGTTGNAKGVVQSYRWIHNYTYIFRVFNKQDDIIYNDLPMYHVGGAFALVARGAFLGCTVALWDKFSPADFWKRIEVSKASNAILLDVMIPWLMNKEPSEVDYVNTLNRVHMQPLPKYHHEVAKRFGIHFVSAGYGQTEAGVGFVGLIDELGENQGTPAHLFKGYTKKETTEIANSLQIPVKNGSRDLAKGYMGRTTPFYEAAVVNENDEICGTGEPGELVLRPRYPHLQLKEYFNKPVATIEAFQNLWFHTGDAGYKDEQDNFYFVDRMKDVIRSKGENISSYQVEDMVNQHSDVKVCAAFPVPAKEGGEDDIVIYVVSQSETLNEDELKKWTQETMPKFMWPKHIKFIDELPRTPTNKVEKYKLKEYFSDGNKLNHIREEKDLEIKASMAGSVWKVLVGAGDEIKDEQDLVILESMKMEIPIAAETSGKISKVNIQEGEFVNEGDVLLTIE